ncbi:amino acid adenylation domain-containing protein [Spizellomyces punctatus DAOM BR117]|uniref:Amino acid adenylation domain-containing protein n=1 Tax=Spizellomyces punctatus (strain DAOM BR117) TaxID=645134 RepID=A0A0L0H5I9_SPIPD|nr:amino acid adenylation domain-containing protein [Spizellomyces punctatus DAOM BR117]KNC96166.1 amino acid adenylation domain-containing protein [Spizellomyces punctatus DAOM BR117]|eukprot:XP_016604206.1 amino acid adenylation domain-containing protein [Spizellomyces punctatus DAOM BR117]
MRLKHQIRVETSADIWQALRDKCEGDLVNVMVGCLVTLLWKYTKVPVHILEVWRKDGRSSRVKFRISPDTTLGEILEISATSLPATDFESLDYVHANDKHSESPEFLETALAGGLKIRFNVSGSLSTSISFNQLLGHREPHTIHIADHWNALLRFIAKNDGWRDTPVKQISIVHGKELDQVMSKWTTNVHGTTLKSYADGPKLLHSHFDASAKRNPRGVALRYIDHDRREELTYRDAAHIIARGVRAILRRFRQSQPLSQEHLGSASMERYVAIFFPRVGMEAYLAMLSILKSGAAYVPIDPAYPPDRVAYIVEDACASLLITTRAMEQMVEESGLLGTGKCTVVFWDELLQEVPVEGTTEEVAISPSAPCYSIYTSGSTGKPKGVIVEHCNASFLVHSESVLFPLNAQDVVLQPFSIAFDASIECIWLAFHNAATLHIPSEVDMKSGPMLADYITEHNISVLSTVPTLLSMIDEDMPTLKLLILGGEACPPALVEMWASRTRLVNTYGPTEATVICTSCDMQPGVPVTIGKPIPNYEIYILDDELLPVPIGIAGEIHVGGDGVTRGYRNRDDLNTEKFIPSPYGPGKLYKTGDLGRWTPEGDIAYLGRADAQVKLRGHRIELGEIESALVRFGHPTVLASCATVQQIEGVDHLIAYIILADLDDEDNASRCDSNSESDTVYAEDVDIQGILGRMRATLPGYMVPTYVEVMNGDFPTLPSGKVDRKKLPVPPPHVIKARSSMSSIRSQRKTLTNQGSFDSMNTLSAESLLVDMFTEEGTTPTERMLRDVWSNILMIEITTPEVDFFALGGHSVLAARLVSELRKSPTVKGVTVRDVYTERTIRGLAARIDTLNGKTEIAVKMKNSNGRQSSQDGSEDASGTDGTVVDMLGSPSDKKELPHVFLPHIVSLILFYVMGHITSFMSLIGYYLFLEFMNPTYFSSRYYVFLVGIALFPVIQFLMFAAAIGLKWLVIGKFRPGKYRLYSFYYWRWWIVSRVTAMVPAAFMRGSPLLRIYLRLLGAKIGRNVHLQSVFVSSFDLITIGDNTSIGSDAHLYGFHVMNGYLHIGRVTIGEGCYVGARSHLEPNTSMGDRAQLGELSCVGMGRHIPSGESWTGSPAEPVDPASILCADMVIPLRKRRSCFGRMFEAIGDFLHALFFVFAYFIMAIMMFGASVPNLILLLFTGNVISSWTMRMAIYIPVMGPIYCVCIAFQLVILKWLIGGRIQPGVYSTRSFAYFRIWFVDKMVQTSLSALGGMYATLYLPPWLSAMGMKVGKTVEVSTAANWTPDLCTLGDRSFLADNVCLGAPVFHGGMVKVSHTEIRERSFVGNSGLMPSGSTIGKNCLIGVNSVPPASLAECQSSQTVSEKNKEHGFVVNVEEVIPPGSRYDVPDGTSWLGSPAMNLPARACAVKKFKESKTFQPSRKRYLQRYLIEFFRVTGPAMIEGGTLVGAFILAMWLDLRWWHLWLYWPLLHIGRGICFCACVWLAKWILIGRYIAQEQPLWSVYVWKAELVSGWEEFGCNPAFVSGLQGTPWINHWFRSLGAKIGRRCYINTVWFCEPDLISIGDNVCLNTDVVLQTHLFEDRIMKMSHLRIEDHVSIGGASVILYDSVIEEGCHVDSLSLAMKGEVLSSWTHWRGTPAQPVFQG